MKQHPLSAAFPAMSDGEIKSLASDIKKHGLQRAIVIYEQQVLDGWHRYRACQMAGVIPHTAMYNGSDPAQYVISANAHRRHLTATQRSAAILACNEWRNPGRNPAPGAGLTEKELAAKADVSERTIRQAKAGVQAGLGEAMRDGQISAKAAAALAVGKDPDAKPEPDPEPEPGDMLKELESADKQIRKLEALVESLRKSDLAKEVEAWALKYDQLEGRLDLALKQREEAVKQATYSSGILAKIRKALGVEKNSEILAILMK